VQKNNAGANANAAGKKGAFRETAWFKRGEIEEAMMSAQAAAGDNPLKSGTTGQHPVPTDESQVDVTAQDQARLSLKTGATQAMPAIRSTQAALPGERMDEYEMLAEINPARKYLLVAGLVVVLAIVLGIVIYFATRSSPKAEAPPPNKPAPVAAAPPATAPSAAPPAVPAATPPTPSPPTPTPPAPLAPPAPSSDYAAALEKLEAAPALDKHELKRIERLLTAELKTAHRKKDRAAEASVRQLLVRVRKLLARKR
jgi:hypothetical protein